MSRVMTVHLKDDIDGTEATSTVTFGVDGRQYEIDLNDKHEQQFRKAIEKFVANARRVGSGRQSKPRAKVSAETAGRADAAAQRREIREWAATNGYDVPAKGRIPQAVVDAWNAS